jgi:putative ABC transport system substrate-binding protein
MVRIGYLDASTPSGRAVRLEPFWQEMHKLGWIEGRNITVEYRFAEQKRERLPELAAEMVRLNVDLIVARGTNVQIAAKNATSTIPIVMPNGSDPVAAGLVLSLARPGGNVTGVASLSSDLGTKRLEILKDTMPKLARVGLLFPPGPSRGVDLQLKELRSAAPMLKLNLDEIKAEPDGEGLENAFAIAHQRQVDAVMMTSNPRFFAQRRRIVELSNKHRLAAIYQQREFVDEGGLMSYAADSKDLYRRAAVYVDKILKGAKPVDLPVERASKFEFVINLTAAKQIGLTIPVRVLERANQVIR